MRTEEQLQDRAWGIAFGHYLSEYPVTATPDEIMQLITDGSEEILYWEPFEYCDSEWMVGQIWTMKKYMASELAWATGQEG